MSDFNRDGAPDARDEDRLPWLEAVEDVDSEDHVSTGKLFGLALAGVLAIGAVLGGVYLMRSTPEPKGDGTVIAAPAGDYKTKADAPGGMKVEGQGDSAFAASEGAQPQGQIDTNATAEAPVAATKGPGVGAPPVVEPGSAPQKQVAVAPPPPPAPKVAPPAPKPVVTADVPKAAPKLVAPPPAKPVTPAVANAPEGSTIQLGAFASEAIANQTWTAMSKRFAYLGSATKSVQVAQVNGKRFYRLRAVAPGQAAEICGKLKVAGENCLIVN